MGTAATIEKSHETGARFAHSREEFERRFGHKFDSSGYHGHPFFGYNCRECGIHISLVRPERWLKAEKLGNFPGLNLPEFAELKAGIPK